MRIRLFCRTRENDLLYYALLLLIVLWNEFLSFRWGRYFWTIPDRSSTEELRILLIADPQLIGYQNEHYMVGPLLRWDADRYLSSGFQQALLSNPDILFFLGDLFDEGVTASKEEFEWTINRFYSIFSDYDYQRVFISGDNDVGGEAEPVQKHLVDRFHNRFNNTIIPWYRLLKHIAISEVNVISKDVRNITYVERPTLRILLSHNPFLSYYEKLIGNIEADIILSAHNHKAFSYVSSRTSGILESTDLSDMDLPVKRLIGPGESQLEFQSPTCSYRMGVPRMGYGFLSISSSPQSDKFIARYSVFWLPSRFHQFTLYIIVICIGFLRLFYRLFSYFRILSFRQFHLYRTPFSV